MLRQEKPPFKPSVKSETDVANFDKTFTKMDVAGVSPPDRSTNSVEVLEDDFDAFTFVEGAALGGDHGEPEELM